MVYIVLIYLYYYFQTYEVTEGKFKPWWIILAVILAVLVCVIIAGIVRQYRKKRKSVALNEKVGYRFQEILWLGHSVKKKTPFF